MARSKEKRKEKIMWVLFLFVCSLIYVGYYFYNQVLYTGCNVTFIKYYSIVTITNSEIMTLPSLSSSTHLVSACGGTKLRTLSQPSYSPQLPASDGQHLRPLSHPSFRHVSAYGILNSIESALSDTLSHKQLRYIQIH